MDRTHDEHALDQDRNADTRVERDRVADGPVNRDRAAEAAAEQDRKPEEPVNRDRGADRAADQGRAASAGQLVVGCYGTYAEAERAVDHLSDNQFPVERTAIVGRGLSSVEKVTGRLTIWRAAGQAAVSGAVLGALFGWIFGLFDWINPLIAGLLLALYGAVFGAVIGGVFGMIAHAMTGGRRDFSSVSELRADSYDLLVDAAHATEAGRLLDAEDAPGRGISA